MIRRNVGREKIDSLLSSTGEKNYIVQDHVSHSPENRGSKIEFYNRASKQTERKAERMGMLKSYTTARRFSNELWKFSKKKLYDDFVNENARRS